MTVVAMESGTGLETPIAELAVKSAALQGGDGGATHGNWSLVRNNRLRKSLTTLMHSKTTITL